MGDIPQSGTHDCQACLPACVPACLCTRLPVYLPAYLSVYPPACVSACLCTRLPVYLPMCLPACLHASLHAERWSPSSFRQRPVWFGKREAMRDKQSRYHQHMNDDMQL